MTDKAKAYCATLGHIPFNVTFVPQSMSRNADNKEPSLNWLVSFGSIQTDYMQGIGHMPGYNFNNRLALYHDRLRLACERGQIVAGEWPHKLYDKFPAPSLGDVLYCLVSDSDVINYDGFEDWAENYGFDTDSRRAEDIYNQCLKIALKLRQLIDLDKAREAFEDF